MSERKIKGLFFIPEHLREEIEADLIQRFGLYPGMAASLLILQYVKYEKSFDAFHDKQSFPYRIAINPIFFIGAGLLVVIIAFISVSSQHLRQR